MVSKNQIKLITSLQQKKYRKQEQLFFAEGVKVVQELLNSNFELQDLFTTKQDFLTVSKDKVHAISEAELKKISALTTPNTCLAVFKMPKSKDFVEKGLIVALDDVRDPGNLGTIIRLCDWFGIETLFCSEESVDIYNPKVVQATMGSISRVNVVYGNLEAFLTKTKLPVFGTFMDGENIYQEKLMKKPRVFISCTFPVQGLFGSLSRINSSFILKTPLIDGEKMKYSKYKSIPNPTS